MKRMVEKWKWICNFLHNFAPKTLVTQNNLFN